MMRWLSTVPEPVEDAPGVPDFSGGLAALTVIIEVLVVLTNPYIISKCVGELLSTNKLPI